MAAHEFAGQAYEFQRLHGMGAPSWLHGIHRNGTRSPVRVYAPVGPHRDLLAYLVRRLLENGANSSFVAQISDPTIPVARLTLSPSSEVKALLAEGPQHVANTALPRPTALYWGDDRQAAPWRGFRHPARYDLTGPACASRQKPSRRKRRYQDVTLAQTEAAIAVAAKAQAGWAGRTGRPSAPARWSAPPIFLLKGATACWR